MVKRGGRKAQITLFVILGLVLLIIIALLYFVVLKKPAVSDEFKAESVPAEFKPVKDYVESCVNSLAVDAVKKMGSHGGYIDPMDTELTPLQLRFSSSQPTRFELASLSGEKETAIPYYLHVPGKASYVNYELGSLAPTIESMQFQMNVYIMRELPGCLEGFAALEEQGFDVSSDDYNIVVDSIIRDDKIDFYITYPLNITKSEAKTSISKFQNTLNFPYKKYYDLAVSMMAAELVTQYLESFTTQLINYHSGLSSNLLPPPIEYSNDPYIITWSNAKVNSDLNSLLQSYVPTLQVEGTKDFTPITVEGNDVEAAFYRSMSMPIFNDTLPNTAISFFYISNTLATKVQPSKGDMIKPSIEVDKGNQYVPASQSNTYKFYYDVAYPVIVEIRGDEPGTAIPEYSFMFALETNLIENKAALAWNMGMGTVEWDYSYLNMTIDIPDGSYVNPDTGEPLDVKPRQSSKSLFCDESTWQSGNISLNTIDASTGALLDGVTVSYGCGDYEECWAGMTELSEDQNSAYWSGKLPICKGGYLSLSKEGYGSRTIQLSTNENEDNWLATQTLDKFRELEASVKKFEIQKEIYREDWEWKEGTHSLGAMQDINPDTEQVILSITQVGFDAGTNPVTNSIIFGKDGVEKSTIKLVPGDYEIIANLIDYNGVVMPANCSRTCTTDIVVCFDYEYYPSEEINMTPAPWGGVELKSGAGAAGTFSVTAAELDSNKEIEFHILKLPDLSKTYDLVSDTHVSLPGGCINNLEEMNKVKDYTAEYKTDLMPVLR